MGQRAEVLAAQFEQTVSALIRVVEEVSDEQWRALCPDEGRSVGVLAYHIDKGITLEMGYFREFVAGRQPAPLTAAQVHAMNAADAEAWADSPQAAALTALLADARAAAEEVRRWDDAALARAGTYIAELPEPWTVEQWVERVLIGHVHSHLRSIRDTLAATAAR